MSNVTKMPEGPKYMTKEEHAASKQEARKEAEAKKELKNLEKVYGIHVGGNPIKRGTLNTTSILANRNEEIDPRDF